MAILRVNLVAIELIDSFNFASDTVKQVIGLSSGILALTVTFAKEQIAKNRPSALLPLKASWFFEIFSLIAGVWALMAITGQVSSTSVTSPSVWALQVTIPAILQIVFFVFAMMSLVLAGMKSFKT